MTTIMLVLMLAASAADLATTEWVIAGGGSEWNPLMQNRAVRIGFGVGIPLLFYAATREHPRLAKWICIVYVGSKSALAGRNFYVGISIRWGET